MVKKLIFTFSVLAVTLFTVTTSAFASYYSESITLRYGTASTEVVRLQRDLQNLGYMSYKPNPSGYFGNMTNAAVIKFQKDNGLYADGIVGHSTAREIKVEQILKLAKSYQGVPYVWGGVSPAGFDCSGFTSYVFLKNGIVVQRTAANQYAEGTWVQRDKLIQGDLVFFSTYKVGPSHVGIYVGNNQFIHASSGAGQIIISDLSNVYYAQHYIGAKRVIR